MNSFAIIATIFVILNATCVLSLVFIERRDIETTWAWLIILLLIPGVGFIIYLALGQNLSREKIFREKITIDSNKAKKFNTNLIGHNENKSVRKFKDLIRMNYNDAGCRLTCNNTVRTYTRGVDKFNDLIEDINNAKEFIHIEYYIFRLDDVGMKIVELLGKKVKEGVKVRLLVDGMGSRGVRGKGEKYIKSLGIEFSVFFPGFTRLINLRINYRNHRKIVVIDGSVGYVGGFNVGDEYITGGEQFEYWRDTHIRVEGEAVKELNKRFSLDWDYAADDDIANDGRYYKDIKTNEDVSVQIVSSGPDNTEEFIKYNYLKIITKAERNLFIQSPYLVLDRPMMEAIKISALSGVDVRIMVPDKPDHLFMKWALSANIGSLIDSGVKFYRYQKGFIHSKTIVADSLVASIGTANMDIRSFRLNFEVNAIVYDQSFALHQEAIFIDDQKDSIIYTKTEYENRSRWFKICESIVRLLSPIL
ncbi:MAG: cardiolipin synthase [Clostridium sp.]